MDTKETSIYYAFLIAAIVVGNIIVYFIISIYRQHLKHRQLYRENIEDIINAREKERARIAADLHDDLGPVLAAVNLKLSGINERSCPQYELVTDSLKFIDALANRVHFIANDLMPDSLLNNGPVSAMEDFITHITANSTLKIVFNHTVLPALSQTKSIHIYRILQEITLNTLRHAKAGRLFIKILQDNNRVIISTADDGQGFNYERSKNKQTGLGLSNIQNRTDMLHGWLFLSSKPGKGTQYRIEIPL
jgi:signal transduction histidine kinase